MRLMHRLKAKSKHKLLKRKTKEISSICGTNFVHEDQKRGSPISEIIM